MNNNGLQDFVGFLLVLALVMTLMELF